MGDFATYAVVVAVVLGVNLLPALGPPTWAVLVWFRLHDGLSVPVLVLLGAVAACAGRFLLASAFALLRRRVSARTKDNLAAALTVLQGTPGRTRAALVLFVVSPIPSAQLFEAAGLVGARLGLLTAAFGVGRLVTYSLYVGGASVTEGTALGRLLRDQLTSPWGIAVQAVLLLGLVALAKVDWHRFLR